eukprot:CAMPEP_0172185416 /NCGR_PEP_ID=MMETSP1050-20130122/20156_1 /TAXON_ID=233186 /ORGANISM="Cryptomonas curvata, Strain CCAP979/52" /LENGTH=37 /DNA_ID= /DNA_START= /DNA_END= /DNA_ORIENTATION=
MFQLNVQRKPEEHFHTWDTMQGWLNPKPSAGDGGCPP